MTPDEFTNNEITLSVGDGHKLYVQDWGRKDAKIPVIFLHGGPGGGCNDGHKGYFNPRGHRVIFFDQRGSGQSTPYGSLKHNTTDDLISDIDKILRHFKFNKVILCGRSWGSTLALVYAIRQPEKIKAIVTGGIFLAGEPSEVINGERVDTLKLFYPDFWDEPDLAKGIEELSKKILGSDADEAKRAAYILSQAVIPTMRLDDRRHPIDFESFDITSTKIETFYESKNWFLPENYIVNNASKLTMPIWIIQGRYDMACLPKYAYELHQKLPNSHLIWTEAGHSGHDRENWLATKTILEQF